MRLFLLTATVLLLQVPAAAAEDIAAPANGQAEATDSGECRRATSYKADADLAWRSDQATPRKLADLPPAAGYMAVYRTVNGCEVPMTATEYRKGRR